MNDKKTANTLVIISGILMLVSGIYAATPTDHKATVNFTPKRTVNQTSNVQIDKNENHKENIFNKLYCNQLLSSVNYWVAKANSYENSVNDSMRDTEACKIRLTYDLHLIHSLLDKIKNPENDNLWKIGSSHLYMRAALTYSINCLSCTSKKSNSMSCSDMREEFKEINCNVP